LAERGGVKGGPAKSRSGEQKGRLRTKGKLILGGNAGCEKLAR